MVVLKVSKNFSLLMSVSDHSHDFTRYYFIAAFKGNARVIIPGMTACIECTLDLFPPQVIVV